MTQVSSSLFAPGQVDSPISVDSLKLRLPLSKVDFAGKRFGYELIEVNSLTGEFVGTNDIRSDKFDRDGVITPYSIRSKAYTDKDFRQDVVLVGLTSKLLGSDYFNGISSDTLPQVYDSLMSQGVIQCDYDVFCSGDVLDCDIKQDFKATSDEFKAVRHVFKSSAKVSARADRGYLEFNRKDNKGIQFGKRERSSPSFPYLKLYDKSAELVNREHSAEFVKAHGISVPSGLVRIEMTISNRKHFRKYGVKDTRISSVASLSQDVYSSMFVDSFKTYLNMRDAVVRMPNDLSPTDEVLVKWMIDLLDNTDYSVDDLIDYTIRDLECKVQRSRMKSRLWALYESYIAVSSSERLKREHAEFVAQILKRKKDFLMRGEK